MLQDTIDKEVQAMTDAHMAKAQEMEEQMLEKLESQVEGKVTDIITGCVNWLLKFYSNLVLVL
eukprot:SAG11_NODE_13349_length_659_cov_0.783929_1_plen_63_part_00